jgi:hypothetical protein
MRHCEARSSPGASSPPLVYCPSMTRPRLGAWARADSTATTSAANMRRSGAAEPYNAMQVVT